MDFLVLRDKAFASGDKITNPESQKIGMDTRKPVRERAISSLPLPKIFKKVRAIRSAAPDISNICPIIIPKPMMIPMLPNVPPNPAVIASTVSAGARPPTRPTITAAIIKARKT